MTAGFFFFAVPFSGRKLCNNYAIERLVCPADTGRFAENNGGTFSVAKKGAFSVICGIIEMILIRKRKRTS